MSKLHTRYSALVATLFFSILLPACSTEGHGFDSPTAKGAAVGAATGAVVGGVSGAGIPVGAGVGAAVGGTYGYFLSKHKTTLQALGAYGVSVMRLGDNVIITIPSNTLFVGYSVQFSTSGSDILNQVAKLLEPMNKVKITIAAYSNSPVQTEKDLFLTQKQAETVSNHLWDQHVDVRLMYAVGYGGGHPVQYAPYEVVDNVIGDRANYRVEITLKDYVQ